MNEWINDGFGNIFLIEKSQNNYESIVCLIKEPFGETEDGCKVITMVRPLSSTELQELVNMIYRI